MRKLGHRQEAFLKAMVRHGYWSSGCGWLWGGLNEHLRMSNSLLKRGLLTFETRNTDYLLGYKLKPYDRWTPTEAGKAYVKGLES